MVACRLLQDDDFDVRDVANDLVCRALDTPVMEETYSLDSIAAPLMVIITTCFLHSISHTSLPCVSLLSPLSPQEEWLRAFEAVCGILKAALYGTGSPADHVSVATVRNGCTDGKGSVGNGYSHGKWSALTSSPAIIDGLFGAGKGEMSEKVNSHFLPILTSHIPQ